MEEHGKVMPHVHFKYAKDDIEEALKNEDWWPTVVREDISAETVKEALKDRIKKAEEEKKNAEVTSLEGWKGTWNNINIYFDDKDVKPAFEKLAEKESLTPEKAEEKYREKKKSDIAALNVMGDTISFLDKSEKDGGKEKAKGKYTFVENMTDDKTKTEWYVFTSEDAPEEYKTFLFMKVHGDGLIHFHARYGSESAEELMKKEGWFPTFIDPSATAQQIADEIAE